MNIYRSALVASVITVALWTIKACAIAVAGGLGKSPIEGPLFMLGLVSCVASCVLVGAAVFARRSVGWRVLGSAFALVAAALVLALAGAVVTAVQPAHPSWVYSEIDLWVVMGVLVGATFLVARTRDVPAGQDVTRLGVRAPLGNAR